MTVVIWDESVVAEEGLLRAWHLRIYLNDTREAVRAFSEENNIEDLLEWLKEQAVGDSHNKTVISNAQGIQIFEDDAWVELEDYEEFLEDSEIEDEGAGV